MKQDDDNDNKASEQQSHHAVRQRCLSALAAMSTQSSVVQESTPVLLEVLSSAHTGNLVWTHGRSRRSENKQTFNFTDDTASGSNYDMFFLISCLDAVTHSIFGHFLSHVGQIRTLIQMIYINLSPNTKS